MGVTAHRDAQTQPEMKLAAVIALLAVFVACQAAIECPAGRFQSWCEATCNHEPPNCPISLCGLCAEGGPVSDDYNGTRITCEGVRFRYWCEATCNHVPSVCPQSLCGGCVNNFPDIGADEETDEEEATPATQYEVASGTNCAPYTAQWCNNNCNHVPPYCPSCCVEVDGDQK